MRTTTTPQTDFPHRRTPPTTLPPLRKALTLAACGSSQPSVSSTASSLVYRLFIALLAVGCAVAIAGCGSSSRQTKSHASLAAQHLKFASCMRSHGVPNFPDPSASGSLGGSGIDPASPGFKAAQSACVHLLAGGSPSGPPSAAARGQLLVFSKCMRAHGVSGFPDPTTTRPFRVSSLVDAGGVYLGIPISIDASSPAFRRAVKACHGPPGF